MRELQWKHAVTTFSHMSRPPLESGITWSRVRCGHDYPRPHLTRDHVMPLSKGGRDMWENVVTACFHCNSRKGNRTPQQANMPLLAVPYRPSWIEHLILSNRNILADQMAFLKNQLPRNARSQM